MKNWKTTLCGALAAVFTGLSAVLTEYKDILIALASVAAAIGLYFSKDSNVVDNG